VRLGGGAELEREAREEVERAVEAARASAFPSTDLTMRLVYA
jgi:TPP-dependent pyruvate/acetoin dehydrogenase alpha subunit